MAEAPLQVPGALSVLDEQPPVRDFLARAVTEGRLSHAYLFLGAPGSGKTEASLALAQCIVCPNGGCGQCDECIRVRHRTHPDVRLIAPESASGYLVEQVRELIGDVSLAPVRGRAKVYVITDAGMLRREAANALLKTIEEPPAGVTFILVGRTVDTILPTIVSRCQRVPFRIVSPGVAVRTIGRTTGARETEARIALAVAGTPERATEFLASASRRQVRRLMVRTITELPHDDEWDVLCSARALVEAVWEAVGRPVAKGRGKADDPVRRALKERIRGQEDYLSHGAIAQIERTVRRELTARERSGMMEALAAAESLLRDALACCEEVPVPIVNQDFADAVERIAASTCTGGVVRALEAVAHAASDIVHNVNPQLAFEVMLLRVKEALACPPSSR
ncbi:MAG: DNA polymerase III subunit delta' C-terminal domain-containing protein [Acidobacteriota bacterium]|nr:DNA polymerase III subunit delta' C-terminal domain-containing protein [Acidobacteriota bacterium]